MSGCSGPAVTPVCCHRCFLRLDDAFTLPVTTWAFDDGQLLGQEFSIIAPTWTAPLLRAHRRASLGAAGRHPWGWRRIQARRSTCLLLLAVQRRRVESLVLGALSSSPVHRALVLVLGTNIAVLLDCPSRLDSVAFLTYLLTYIQSSMNATLHIAIILHHFLSLNWPMITWRRISNSLRWHNGTVARLLIFYSRPPAGRKGQRLPTLHPFSPDLSS